MSHPSHRGRLAAHPLLQLVAELALAVAALAGGAALIRALGRAAPPGGAPDLVTPPLGAALALGALLVGLRYVERRPPAAAGLVRAHAGRDLGLGFGAGVAAMGVAVALLAAAGWYRVAAVAPAAAVPGLLARWGWMFFGTALLEEVLFRAIVFRLVERAAGTWVALGVSALLFGGAHLANPHATLGGALAIALEAGVPLAALFVLTRSLWPVVGLHWGWDLAEGPLFGTQVSGNGAGGAAGPGGVASVLHAHVSGPALWTGGAFGPEAGLVVVLLWAAVGAVLLARAARAGRFVAAPWERGTGSRPAAAAADPRPRRAAPADGVPPEPA